MQKAAIRFIFCNYEDGDGCDFFMMMMMMIMMVMVIVVGNISMGKVHKKQWSLTILLSYVTICMFYKCPKIMFKKKSQSLCAVGHPMIPTFAQLFAFLKN